MILTESKIIDNYLFFSKRTCLSQWFKRSFIVEGKSYTSMEQYMMYNKAILFKDNDIALKILNTNDPKTILQLGRQVKDYHEQIWSPVRFDIVYKGTLEKFNQNKDLKEYLISTKDLIIHEAFSFDKIWAIGFDIDSPEVNNLEIEKYGQSLLGKVLMKVRGTLNVG